MDYKKNDLVTVDITDIGQDGEGIGRIDGYTLFVKDAVIGDHAEVKLTKCKKNYAYARVNKILTPSPDRVTPPCPIAGPCGGCQIQMLSYEAQLRFKEEKIRNCLTRIGGFDESEIPMEPIIGMENPYRYRNKAQFPIGYDRDGNLIAGFYAGRTHSIIPVSDCLLGAEENRIILEKILLFMKENRVTAYDETKGTGLVRHVLIRKGFHTGQWMVCLVINGKKLPKAEKLIESLKEIKGMTSISISINREQTNVIMGTEIHCLWGSPTITDTIGDVEYRISPLSFYQVNPVQTEKLYGLACDYAALTGSETVWDLYCGIGTISLFLARKAGKVYGVEIIPDAIRDARENAECNHLTNTEFFVGKAEEVLPEQYKKYGVHADVIVVDPPRKGCDETLLWTMIQMAPKRIVYVSCDPATLARDLKILCENGYKPEKVRGVDQFGHTVHVETVVLLSKVHTLGA